MLVGTFSLLLFACIILFNGNYIPKDIMYKFCTAAIVLHIRYNVKNSHPATIVSIVKNSFLWA